jgi:hypothetical protein
MPVNQKWSGHGAGASWTNPVIGLYNAAVGTPDTSRRRRLFD